MAKKSVIDPGHGGNDPGALGNGLKEKDYTLKISKYMADRFNELGIPVILTRDEDITLTPNERTQRVLDAFGNDSDVIVISNHLNAGGGEGSCGKLTFFEKFKIIVTEYYYFFCKLT